MGLAALGAPRYAQQVRRLIRFHDGEIRLDLDYFNFQYADKGTWFGPRFAELFGPPRRAGEPIDSGGARTSRLPSNWSPRKSASRSCGISSRSAAAAGDYAWPAAWH